MRYLPMRFVVLIALLMAAMAPAAPAGARDGTAPAAKALVLQLMRGCLPADPLYIRYSGAADRSGFGAAPPGLAEPRLVAQRLSSASGQVYRLRDTPDAGGQTCGLAVYDIPAGDIAEALDALLATPAYDMKKGVSAISWPAADGVETHWGSRLGMDGLRILVRPPSPGRPSLEVIYQRVMVR